MIIDERVKDGIMFPVQGWLLCYCPQSQSQKDGEMHWLSLWHSCCLHAYVSMQMNVFFCEGMDCGVLAGVAAAEGGERLSVLK